MVKQKFTSLDCRASLQSVDFLRGAKLSNIYDINSKLYILKFQHRGPDTNSADADKKQNKFFLLLEAGVRFHLTNFERDKSVIPSSYTMKLRKHLRSKRLENVYQLGQDRVLVLQFGSGERTNFLVLEMYVRGNLVLCDMDWKILILLRTHVFDEDDRCAVKSEYPRNQRAMQSLTQEEVDGLSEAEFEAVIVKELANATSQGKKPAPSHMLLCRCLTFAHPAMCTAVLKELGVAKPTDSVQAGMGQTLARGAQRCIDILNSVTLAREDPASTDDRGCAAPIDDRGDETRDSAVENTIRAERCLVPGFIQTRPMKGDNSKVTFEEFCPVESLLSGDTIKFDNFCEAVDTFFAQIEEQKYEESKAQHATTIKNRVDNIRQDQEKRLAQLQSDQELRGKQAELVEMNIELVDQALLMINTGLAAGLDWNALHTQVKQTRKQGHPITSYIHHLDFERNEISMLLGDETDPDGELQVVQLDLSLNAYSNVGALHGVRKQQKQKHHKTELQAEAAVRIAEKKANAEMKKFEEKMQVKGLRKVRKHWWFEKFYWFISSENYLVVAGRDAQQNEQLFRKYLAKTDVFAHADITGASSVVVKNPGGGEIPPLTLQEAGTMTMCRSKAWDNKVVISAWWVWGSQVSKTAPTGEFLVSGGFMIRGKKHFLPPLKLEMGMGLLFELTPESVWRHAGERVTKYQEAQLQDTAKKPSADNSEDDNDSPDEGESPGASPDCGTEIPAVSPCESPEGSESECEEEILDAERCDVKLPMAPEDKYGLHVDEEDDEGIPEAKNAKPQNSKVRMSKAERKRLKKGGDPDGPVQPKPQPTSKPSTPPVIAKRGQKAKDKKRAKYADQDPEERELRLRLLGAKLPLQDSGNEDCDDTQAEAEPAPKEEARREVEEKKCYLCQKCGHIATECPEKRKPVEDDEDEPQLAPSDVQLDLLTGKPFASDEVLGALAMCAPFTAVQNYHFRVKITPGTMKKGKLAQMSMRMFQTDALDIASKYMEDDAGDSTKNRGAAAASSSKDSPAGANPGGVALKVWRDLARAIPDTELISVLVNAAKISSPGIQKVQVAMKKERKNEAKRREEG